MTTYHEQATQNSSAVLLITILFSVLFFYMDNSHIWLFSKIKNGKRRLHVVVAAGGYLRGHSHVVSLRDKSLFLLRLHSVFCCPPWSTSVPDSFLVDKTALVALPHPLELCSVTFRPAYSKHTLLVQKHPQRSSTPYVTIEKQAALHAPFISSLQLYCKTLGALFTPFPLPHRGARCA